MFEELPDLREEVWKAAAAELQRTGWLSEYGDASFYVKSVNRKFCDEIKERLFRLSAIDVVNIAYIEVNVDGANGWAFYNSEAFTLGEAREKLYKETDPSNYTD